MGKKTKKKLKWTNLEIETKTGNKYSGEKGQENEPNPTHPFLKIISKNLDVIIKKDSVNSDDQDNSEETKFVYLYRSDQAIPVPNPEDPTNYIGAPIQYTYKPTPLNTQKSQGKDQKHPEQQISQNNTMQEYHQSGIDTQYSVESTQSLGSVNWEDQVSPLQNQTVYYYQAPMPMIQYPGQPSPEIPFQTQTSNEQFENKSEVAMSSPPNFTPPTTYTHQPPPSNQGLTTYPAYTEAPIYNPSDGSYCQPIVESTISQPMTYVPHPAYVQPTHNPPPGLTPYTQATSHPPTTTTYAPPLVSQVPLTPSHPTTYIPSTHPVMYHPHVDPSHQQTLPVYLPALPQELQNQNVQYVPYYYYYPVPVPTHPIQTETVEVPTQIPTENQIFVESDITSSTCFCKNHEEDPMEACDPGSAPDNLCHGNFSHPHIPISHISASSSTTSCESCNFTEKPGRTLKKRKKRRKQSGAEIKLIEDNDSGYLNGTESSKNSSDLEQEKMRKPEEKSEVIDVVIETISELGNLKIEETTQLITDEFIEQIQNPTPEPTYEHQCIDENCETNEVVFLQEENIITETEMVDLKVEKVNEKVEQVKCSSNISEETTNSVNDIILSEENISALTIEENKSMKKELPKLSENDKTKHNIDIDADECKVETEKPINDNISSLPKISYSAVCQKGHNITKVTEVKEIIAEENNVYKTTVDETKLVTINKVASTSEWKEVSINKRANGRKKNKGAQNIPVNTEQLRKTQKGGTEVMDSKNKSTELTKKVQFNATIIPSPNAPKEKKLKNKKNISKAADNTNSAKKERISEQIDPTDEKVLSPEKSEKCHEDEGNKNLPPLSDVKDSFWREKEVEIVELKPSKNKKGSVKKRKSNKTNQHTKPISIIEKQNKFLEAENARGNQETDQTLIKDLENLNLPLLFLRPTDTHNPTPQRASAQYPRSCNKINCNSYCGMSMFPWHCVDESLINSKLGRRDYGQKHENDKKVILIRDQNPFKSQVKRDQGAQKYKKEHVPGPRLQYTTGYRTGPLGVTRRVVPPLSLIHRLNSL